MSKTNKGLYDIESASIIWGGRDIAESEIAAGRRGIFDKVPTKKSERHMPVNITIKELLDKMAPIIVTIIDTDKRQRLESLLKRCQLALESIIIVPPIGIIPAFQLPSVEAPKPQKTAKRVGNPYKPGDYVRVTGFKYTHKNRAGLMDYLINRVIKVDEPPGPMRRKYIQVDSPGWVINIKDIIPATRAEYEAQEAAEQQTAEQPYQFRIGDIVDVRDDVPEWLKAEWGSIFYDYNGDEAPREAIKIIDIGDGIMQSDKYWRYPLAALKLHTDTPEMIDIVPASSQSDEQLKQSGDYLPPDTVVDDWIREDPEHA